MAVCITVLSSSLWFNLMENIDGISAGRLCGCEVTCHVQVLQNAADFSCRLTRWRRNASAGGSVDKRVS